MPPQGGRDNTRTLQLLPCADRSGYAALQVEVHEDLGGRISVQYQGKTIATQDAPPRPGLLRAAAACVPGNGQSRWASWPMACAKRACQSTLQTGDVDRSRRTRKSRASPDRGPTPSQGTIWHAVQAQGSIPSDNRP